MGEQENYFPENWQEQEALCGAIHAIGMEESGPPIPPNVLAKLAELKAIEIQPDGTPTLTEFGWRQFSIIESGNGRLCFEGPE